MHGAGPNRSAGEQHADTVCAHLAVRCARHPDDWPRRWGGTEGSCAFVHAHLQTNRADLLHDHHGHYTPTPPVCLPRNGPGATAWLLTRSELGAWICNFFCIQMSLLRAMLAGGFIPPPYAGRVPPVVSTNMQCLGVDPFKIPDSHLRADARGLPCITLKVSMSASHSQAQRATVPRVNLKEPYACAVPFLYRCICRRFWRMSSSPPPSACTFCCPTSLRT
jgi:hypothetical protein